MFIFNLYNTLLNGLSYGRGTQQLNPLTCLLTELCQPIYDETNIEAV